jgi:hypothetical protein
MESHPIGARAGLLRLIFDPFHFVYSLATGSSILRTDLFSGSNQAFMDRSSEGSPSWVADTDQTMLQVDRKNNLTDYK